MLDNDQDKVVVLVDLGVGHWNVDPCWRRGATHVKDFEEIKGTTIVYGIEWRCQR